MPRNMSFMLTTEQVRNRTKTVTRRMGWKFLKPGDILNAVEKCQGLKKGEKVKYICQIRVLNVMQIYLWTMTYDELKKEGFPDMSIQGFIRMFCLSHKGCTRNSKVTRIEFEYI